MNKLYLMKNPDLFQGEKYLKSKKDYFEGWYFKNTNGRDTISFIPGISINKRKKKAFIQVITNDKSYFIDYDIDDFKFSHNPFSIIIKNNYFSKDKIHIDIDDDHIKIKGDIKYLSSSNIDSNIMGPFSYVPFMECNHAILSMKNSVDGMIKINNKKIKFKNGIGYIEKDFGTSFPSSYIWLQGNNFKNKDVSFMFSKAIIPFKVFKFDGLICTILIKDREYRFATYNNAKILVCDIDSDFLNIILKKGEYILKIKAKYSDGQKLIAPIKGQMKKDIVESVTGNIDVVLKKSHKVIFEDSSSNCGIEIVKLVSRSFGKNSEKNDLE